MLFSSVSHLFLWAIYTMAMLVKTRLGNRFYFPETCRAGFTEAGPNSARWMLRPQMLLAMDINIYIYIYVYIYRMGPLSYKLVYNSI